MSINTLLQMRRGTRAEWLAAPAILGRGVLYAGEIGYETDSGRYKIGDGSTAWSSLKYASVLSQDFLGVSGIGTTAAVSGESVTISVTGIQSTQVNDFDSAVLALIASSGTNLSAGFGINLSGNNPTEVSVTGMTHSLAVGTGIGLDTTTLNGNNVYAVNVTGIAHTLVTDWTEAVQDTVGTDAGSTGFLRNGSGVAWTYDDANNTLVLAVTGIPHTLVTDWDNAVANSVDTVLIGGTGIDLQFNSGSNSLTIGVTGVSLAGHTHVWSEVTDASQKASLTELAYLSGVTPGTASASRAVVLDASKAIAGLGAVTSTGTVTTQDLIANGNAVIAGNLTVNGTTTTVNSTVTTLDDPVLTLGGDTAPTGVDAKDRGIEFRYYDSSAKVGFFGWDNSTGKWAFLTDATNTSEAFTGTKGEVDAYVDWSNLLNTPTMVLAGVGVTGILTGDVQGTGTTTLTDGGMTLTIATTVQPNSVALGGDTTGSYVDNINVSGVGLSVSNGSGEGVSAVITSNATSANTASTLMSRGANGEFAAGTGTLTAAVVSDLYVNGPLYDINGQAGASGTVLSSTGAGVDWISLSELAGVNGSGTTNYVTKWVDTDTVTNSVIFDNGSSVGIGTATPSGALTVAGTGYFTAVVGDGADLTNLNASNISAGTVDYERLPLASVSATGIARFDSGDFSVTAGLVSVKVSGIGNAQLENDSVTFGTTSVALGASSNRIDGLVAISGASAAAPTVLTFCTIDGGTP